MSSDLLEFLEARLAEDEAVARAATPGPWRYNPNKHWRQPGTARFEESVFAGPAGATAVSVAGTGETDDPQSMADAAHIARHDPARVLAEVAAKRRTLARHSAAPGGEELAMPLYCAAHAYKHRDGTVSFPVQLDDCPDLRDLALPYDWHPSYREEWRPS